MERQEKSYITCSISKNYYMRLEEARRKFMIEKNLNKLSKRAFTEILSKQKIPRPINRK